MQTLAILDFGSQYTQVIARRLREMNVHSHIYRYDTPLQKLIEEGIIGIILSGGPASVLSTESPRPDMAIMNSGIPVLGICYGVQLMAHELGGAVESSTHREYGYGTLTHSSQSSLLRGVSSSSRIWNSHGDKVTALPKGFIAIAETENAPFAVIADEKRRLYGLQFHPEVAHSEPVGKQILENFLDICGSKRDWQMSQFITEAVAQIQAQVGEKHVVLGLSGGVDSSVAAALIHKAIGHQLTCIFVDHGLLRANERIQVEALFRDHFEIDLRVIDARERFLKELDGVTDPETKRKTIGRLFVEIFEKAVHGLDHVEFLAQGTLYPDVIESVSIAGNPSAVIKTHHNVGGLPARMKLKLLEPLRELFKDEVRVIGKILGLPQSMIERHPFPGPGLALRIIGEITPQRLATLQAADKIFIDELRESGLYSKVWQAFAVFLPVNSVGVMGDERVYDPVIALRCVNSTDAMTADWSRLPYDFLQKVSSRITNEVKGVSRVVYDISSKPPATIEWE
jgi:GMP synthase (glutamine-hydrolysing)